MSKLRLRAHPGPAAALRGDRLPHPPRALARARRATGWRATSPVAATSRWAVDAEAYLELCDRLSIETSINLDGGWDAELEANLDRLDRAHPGRFVTFCQLDWTRATAGDGFGDELAESLRRSAAAGARGLKVWKTLGLGFRDAAGELLLPDDERAAPVFAAAGELGLPVLIHTADPPAFFDPVDRHNERLEELLAHPEWSFAGPGLPFARAADGVVRGAGRGPPAERRSSAPTWRATPRTSPGSDRCSDRLPNLCVDISARVSDLGRQPRAARRFIDRHRDRILFGSDLRAADRRGTASGSSGFSSRRRGYEYAGDEVPPPAGAGRSRRSAWATTSCERVYADNARRHLRPAGEERAMANRLERQGRGRHWRRVRESGAPGRPRWPPRAPAS